MPAHGNFRSGIVGQEIRKNFKTLVDRATSSSAAAGPQNRGNQKLSCKTLFQMSLQLKRNQSYGRGKLGHFSRFSFLYAHIRDNWFENNAKFVKTSKLQSSARDEQQGPQNRGNRELQNAFLEESLLGPLCPTKFNIWDGQGASRTTRCRLDLDSDLDRSVH